MRVRQAIWILCFSFAFCFGNVNATDVSRIFSDIDATAGLDVKKVIIEKAKEKLTKRYKEDSCRINLSPRWIPNSLLKKDPRDIISVELAGGIQQYTNFDVIYEAHNKKSTKQIQLITDIKTKVPVATQRLQTGEKITNKDFQYRWISLLEYKGELVKAEEDLIDKTIRRTLLAGQPVRQSFISTEYIIEAGDQVTLIVRRSGIQVQVTAEARENGAKGEEINLYSEETRRKYVGEVIKPGVILWKKTL